MKRFFILVVIATLCLGGTAVAEQSTLINFSELVADYPPDNPTEDQDTLLDFSDTAGSVFSEEEKQQMRTSLAIENWEVVLTSSSRFVENQAKSLVKSATVREEADRYAGETVMGVRVNFPQNDFNSWALVQPPFEIPAYADPTEVQDDGTLTVPEGEEGSGDKYVGAGVLKNVGTLKSISVTVHGLNFPHGFSVILQDETNEQKEVFMNYLDFNGWRTLEWENPNYVENVRNRELRELPLYPNLQPMRKLIGFRIYKDGSMPGGDFITYIKDVTLTYDLAVLDLQRDINNEQVWGILQERERARREAELRRLGNVQVQRYLEQQKMDDPEERQQEGGQQQGGGQQQ
jgi:hypothetical protein